MQNKSEQQETQGVSNILLRIDCKGKKKQMVLTKVKQRVKVGPFDFDVAISGDYDLTSRAGFIACQLDVKQPFTRRQTLYLASSALKLKYRASILQVLQSFGLSSDNELNKYFDINMDFQLVKDLIQKGWSISGSLKSDKYYFTIFWKKFEITEILYNISGKGEKSGKVGKGGNIQENKVSFFFTIADLALRVEHFFGKREYLLEGHMEDIPFGKLISNLTNGIDGIDASSALNSIQLKDAEFKFINFSNFNVDAVCLIGTCHIGIKNGRFKSSFSPPQNFSFKVISTSLQFLDELGLSKLKIEANNSGEGLKIDGIFAISKIKNVADLASLLKQPSALDLVFALTILNWKSITAKLSFLRNQRFNSSVMLNSLDLIISATAITPEFGISGEVSAQICNKEFVFMASFTLGITVQFTAELVGTWENPLGLKNSQIKDLLLTIAPSGFGMAGEIKLGEMQCEIAVLFDAVNPSRNMIHFQMHKFQLVKVLSVFDVSIPSPITRILNEINVELMRVDVVPPGGVKMGEKYYEQGFASELKCQIFGFKAHFLLEFRKLQFRLFGQIDQIKIPHILTLKSSKQPAKGPSVDVLAAQSFKSHFKIDGALSIIDLVDIKVQGKADANGIYFTTESAIKILGLNFIESSFLLKAGLLRASDSFLLEASFKTDARFFQIVEKILKNLARNAMKSLEEAQADLTKAQEGVMRTKQKLEYEKQRQKDRIKNEKLEYDRVFNKHKQEAQAALQNERARAARVLEAEKRNANRKLRKAIKDAEQAFQNSKRRAGRVFDDEKATAQRKLQSARRDIADAFRGPKEKVDSIHSKIRDYEDAPWYEFWKKAALAGLYTAYGVAKGVLIAAEETAKASTVVAEQTYKQSLNAAYATCSGILDASYKVCSLAIAAAKQTYKAALQSANAIYSEAVNAADAVYSQAITLAKQLADKAADAYIAMIDAAFALALKAFDAANLSVWVAKQALATAEAATKYAIQFLAKLANGLASILTVKQLLFEFDLKKEKTTIRIGLIVLGKTLKTRIEITFKQTVNFLNILADKIWNFILEKM